MFITILAITEMINQKQTGTIKYNYFSDIVHFLQIDLLVKGIIQLFETI